MRLDCDRFRFQDALRNSVAVAENLFPMLVTEIPSCIKKFVSKKKECNGQ